MADTMRPPWRSVAQPRPAGRAPLGPLYLPTVAPVPAPTAPRSGATSLAAAHAAYPSAGPGRTDGSPTKRSNSTIPTTIGTGPAEACLLTPADHPVARREPESRATRQHDGVHSVNRTQRVEQRPFASAGCRSAHLTGSDSPWRKEHHRTTGARAGVCPVADPDPRYVS